MKQIKMTVTTNEYNQDVFRLLETSELIEIVLTEDEGTNDLKRLFVYLLGELFSDDVEVTFEKTTGYGIKMYEEVCEEYIAVLNGELAKARVKILEEGLQTE